MFNVLFLFPFAQKVPVVCSFFAHRVAIIKHARSLHVRPTRRSLEFENAARNVFGSSLSHCTYADIHEFEGMTQSGLGPHFEANY